MKRRILQLVLLAICVAFVLCGCGSGTSQDGYNAPRVSDNEASPTGSETQWDAVFFGSYPAAEVVGVQNDNIDAAVLEEGDIIADEKLFGKLEQAEWKDDIATVGGDRYLRITAEALGREAGYQPQHYRIDKPGDYHYFRFEPVKWRVLENSDGVLTLMSAKALTAHKYNEEATYATWAESTLRSWLNGYGEGDNAAALDYSDDSFINSAFTADEQKDMVLFDTENADNYYFGTSCGDATQDYVLIPSESDVLFTDTAVAYGFTNDDGTDDPVRRLASTTFAKFCGAWWSMDTGTSGNAFWGLRTNGYTTANNVYICEYGYGYNRGIGVTCDDIGIIPMIKVNASSEALSPAGTISSLDILGPAASGEDEGEDADVKEPSDKQDRGWMKAPVVEKDEKSYSGQVTTWTCLDFGSYPSTEIVKDEFTAVDDYALQDGDYEVDADLYAELEAAKWGGDNTAKIDGERYYRLSSGNATLASIGSEQHYKWKDLDEYHYFRFDPIRWRILDIDGDKALVCADRGVDCQPFNDTDTAVSWESSYLRNWLNGNYEDRKAGKKINSANNFLGLAFTKEEQKLILDSKLENRPNAEYGTSCGGYTEDKIFLLSMDDVYIEDSLKHGYVYGDGIDDPARRVTSTLFAKARGSWWSPVDEYKGNSFWFMRASGYTQQSISYICDFGYIYPRGTMVTCDDACILPAMWITLDPEAYEKSGTRLSTEIIK